jgi:hypothetical protein
LINIGTYIIQSNLSKWESKGQTIFFPLIQVSQLKSVPIREVAISLFPLIEVNMKTGLEEVENAMFSYKFPLTEVRRRLPT